MISEFEDRLLENSKGQCPICRKFFKDLTTYYRKFMCKRGCTYIMITPENVYAIPNNVSINPYISYNISNEGNDIRIVIYNNYITFTSYGKSKEFIELDGIFNLPKSKSDVIDLINRIRKLSFIR